MEDIVSLPLSSQNLRPPTADPAYLTSNEGSDRSKGMLPANLPMKESENAERKLPEQAGCQGRQMEVENSCLKVKGTRFKRFRKAGKPSTRCKKACENIFLALVAVIILSVSSFSTLLYLALEVSEDISTYDFSTIILV